MRDTVTVFIANYYEWTSTTTKEYYEVYPERQRRTRTTRLAERAGPTLIYMFGDHPSPYSGQAWAPPAAATGWTTAV